MENKKQVKKTISLYLSEETNENIKKLYEKMDMKKNEFFEMLFYDIDKLENIIKENIIEKYTK